MQQQTADDKIPSFQAVMANNKRCFVEKLPKIIADIDSLLDDIYESDDSEKVIEAIGHYAHRLHGLSGSYGFLTIGAAAAKVEHEVNAAMFWSRLIAYGAVEAHGVAPVDLIEFKLKLG